MNITNTLIDIVTTNPFINYKEIQEIIYGDNIIDKDLLFEKIKDINSGLSYYVLGCMFDKFKNRIMSIYYLQKSKDIGYMDIYDQIINEIICEMDNECFSSCIRENVDYKKYKEKYEELQSKYNKLEKYTTHLLTKPESEGGNDYKKAKDRFETKNYDI